MEATASFKIGEKAVYPAHGVGVVEAIEKKEISGSQQTFYVLRILANGMTVMVPTEMARKAGMRGVIPSGKVSQVYEILRLRKEVAIKGQTWNRRFREYSEKIKTGSLFEIAEVLRDLAILQETKELSFGERKMLETARSLLVKELAVASRTEEAKVEAKINDIFT